MLHIVNKSPSQSRTLDSCLRLAQPGSAVLLIEDGVYAATRGNADGRVLHAACTRLQVYALESLEVVLITATFDQDVSLVFIDDGVYEIVKGQNPKGIGIKNHAPTYRALDGYDVEKLYVERESMQARGLTEDDLLVDVEVLSSAEMADLMAEQDVVLSF